MTMHIAILFGFIYYLVLYIFFILVSTEIIDQLASFVNIFFEVYN
jgi:hypothetical protein